MKTHPPIPKTSEDRKVLARLKARGYRRLRVGEIRRATDVYADRNPIYSATTGHAVNAGDFIFRRTSRPSNTAVSQPGQRSSNT